MIGLVDADPCRGEELDSPDGRNRRIHELEERLTRLNRASLRITRDLCLDSMLQGVIDSALRSDLPPWVRAGVRDSSGGRHNSQQAWGVAGGTKNSPGKRGLSTRTHHFPPSLPPFSR